MAKKSTISPQEKKAVQQLSQLVTAWGGNVFSGKDSKGRVTELSLSVKQCSDKDFQAIAALKEVTRIESDDIMSDDRLLAAAAKLPKLETLHVGGPKMTDRGFAFLEGHPTLSTLWINGSKKISSAAIKSIATIPNLTQLWVIHSKKITNADLAVLAGLKALTRLDLGPTTVDDKGLQAVASLTNLRQFNLWKCRVKGAGVTHLQAAANLAHLRIDDSLFDDEGLAAITGLQNVTLLSLDDSSLTDAGLENFIQAGGLPKLEELHLKNTKITGPGIKFLAKLPKLNTLLLTSCPLEKGALASLAQCTKLRELSLMNTPFRAKERDQLKKKLRRCRIAVSFSYDDNE